MTPSGARKQEEGWWHEQRDQWEFKDVAGRTVVLTHNQFWNHIVFFHPLDMPDLAHLIEPTLQSPAAMYQESDPPRWRVYLVYYGLLAGRPPYNYLKVAVRSDTRPMFLVSAYPVAEIVTKGIPL